MFSPINLENVSPKEQYQYMARAIGNEFHEYREKSGLSLRTIYNDEKISVAVISDLENGKKLPRVETLLRLMHKVKMPYDSVLSAKLILQKNTAAKRIGKIQESYFEQEQGEFCVSLKKILLAAGYNRREIEDIFKYMDFIASKR